MARLGPNRTALERTLEARELADRADVGALVVVARHVARQLDAERQPSAAIVGQYRLILAELMKVPLPSTEVSDAVALAQLRIVD